MYRCLAALSRRRLTSDAAQSTGRIVASAGSVESDPVLSPHRRAVYRLPLYGADESVIQTLPDEMVDKALRMYGGLMRKYDEAGERRDRLMRLTRAFFRPKQLTIEGVVVSDKMDKSVVVVARRPAYAKKLRLKYYKTRRFMAHDELNLCREGDCVVIRSCRPLSKHKSHVVVENFGDGTPVEKDGRKIEFN